MADHIEVDTWYMENDCSVNPRSGIYRIITCSAYAARREQGTTARPTYVATVYSAETAREIVVAHNSAAALRARVAELEAERGLLVARCEIWAREFHELDATSRARVAELEAEVAALVDIVSHGTGD